MKSAARNSYGALFGLFVLVLLPELGYGQQTTADCPDPPGGKITCEKQQLAICSVTAGKVDGRCQTPPRNMSPDELDAWTLSEVMNRKVKPSEVKGSGYATILREKKAFLGDTKVYFVKPRTVYDPLSWALPEKGSGSEPGMSAYLIAGGKPSGMAHILKVLFGAATFILADLM